MVSGIYFVLRTGLPWRDLPKEFGPWSSVYTRFRRWCKSERWSQMLALFTAEPCSSLRSVADGEPGEFRETEPGFEPQHHEGGISQGVAGRVQRTLASSSSVGQVARIMVKRYLTRGRIRPVEARRRPPRERSPVAVSPGDFGGFRGTFYRGESHRTPRVWDSRR
jgi:hypothetical protein